MEGSDQARGKGPQCQHEGAGRGRAPGARTRLGPAFCRPVGVTRTTLLSLGRLLSDNYKVNLGHRDSQLKRKTLSFSLSLSLYIHIHTHIYVYTFTIQEENNIYTYMNTYILFSICICELYIYIFAKRYSRYKGMQSFCV